MNTSHLQPLLHYIPNIVVRENNVIHCKCIIFIVLLLAIGLWKTSQWLHDGAKSGRRRAESLEKKLEPKKIVSKKINPVCQF